MLFLLISALSVHVGFFCEDGQEVSLHSAVHEHHGGLTGGLWTALGTWNTQPIGQ